MDHAEKKIDRQDISLFSHVLSQSTENDKRSLLALQAAFRQRKEYVYLEIGSYRGGSLQPYVVDPKCRQIISIDPRPYSLADERGDKLRYFENTTQAMLEALAQVPDANLSKIKTIEEGTDTFSPAKLECRPDFCFIDGEHTDAAVVRDSRFCLAAVQQNGCLAYHDANIVYKGIDTFLKELTQSGRTYRSYLLPDSIVLIELDDCRVSEFGPVQALQRDNCQGYLWSLIANDGYRNYFNLPLLRLFRFCKLKTWDTGPMGRLRRILRRE